MSSCIHYDVFVLCGQKLSTNYKFTKEIISDCAKPVSGSVLPDVFKDFEAAYNGLTSLPIRKDGQIIENLHVFVDDWGNWRAPSAPPERRWHIYSERANAVVLRSVLFEKGGLSAKWRANVMSGLASASIQTKAAAGVWKN